MHKVLFLSLLFLLELCAEGAIDEKAAYKPLMHKLACAQSEKTAIVSVDNILEEEIGIRTKSLFSKNVYIRHKKNSRGEFCVEGIVTQEGLTLFDAELDENYESIMGEIEDLNDGISYAEKQAEVEWLFTEVNLYNSKIEKAGKIGAIKAQRINATKESLNKMINAVPVVTYTVKGCDGVLHSECPLTFVSSFRDDSSKVAYRWNFGDGTVSSRTNPIHNYKEPGTYKVSLRITDGGKKYAEASKKLRIAAKPKARVKEKPNAVFSIDRALYTTGDTIAFTNLSSSDTSPLTQTEWDFGDGTKSTLSSPSHRYKKEGTFMIRLQVENSDGLKDSVEQTLNIVHPAIVSGANSAPFSRVMDEFGEPDDDFIKEGTLVTAYRYGKDWLLVKHNIVECRIKGDAFKTNLMGSPRDCNWYENHARTALYD